MKSEISTGLASLLAGNSHSKQDVERRLAEIGLGVALALQSGEMPLEQAERDLLNLETYQAARKHRLNRQLLEFLEWGMELADVAEHASDGLQESYDQMIALARRVIEATVPRKRRLPVKNSR